MAVCLKPLVNGLTPDAVFIRVCGVKIIEANSEALGVFFMGRLHVGDLLLWCDPQFFSGQHDGRAVGIVGTHIDAIITARFLEAHPYVSLHLFQEVAQM